MDKSRVHAAVVSQVAYRLVGVLVHQGSSVNMGHYYSYVRGSNNTWYEMDDQTVRQVRKRLGLVSQPGHQASFLSHFPEASHTPLFTLCCRFAAVVDHAWPSCV
jgi:ubiquitin C-terminal hydrolase